MKNKELVLALIISSALAIAILSLPDVMTPIAQQVLKILGYLWPLAIFIIGIIHGLKPDEHTWPITVSYGLMQRNLKGAMLSTLVFAMALTLVWTSLSALTSQLFSFFESYSLDPLVDIIVGITMIGVASYLILRKERRSVSEKEKEYASADYKVIWIHGIAAAFGGDFIVVLILTLAIVPIIGSGEGFLIGLTFGMASWLAQSLVVALVYKGVIRGVKDLSIMVRAGRLSLLFLGVFMIGLGVFSFMV